LNEIGIEHHENCGLPLQKNINLSLWTFGEKAGGWGV
jgi:hypothetical protein